MSSDPAAVVEAEVVGGSSETAPVVEKTAEQLASEAAATDRETAALAKRSVPYEAGGIVLSSMADALSWAKAVIDSRMAPKGYTRPSQILVAIQTGKELGLGMATSLRALYPAPGGQAQLYAEAALALCVRSGLLTDHYPQWTGEGDALACTYFVKRKGWPDFRSITYSVQDAMVARLVKADSNWVKSPKDMVKARSLSKALHTWFADVILGVPVEGDLEGVDETPDAHPAQPPPPVVKARPAGGFGLLDRIEKAVREPDAAGSGSQTGATPASEGSAPASGGVAAAGRLMVQPTKAEQEAPRARLESAGSDATATVVPTGAGVAPAEVAAPSGVAGPQPGDASENREQAAEPPQQPAEAAGLDTQPPKPAAAGGASCDHSAAVEYRREYPAADEKAARKPFTCPACSLLIVLTAKGPVVVEEPPPPSKPKAATSRVAKGPLFPE